MIRYPAVWSIKTCLSTSVKHILKVKKVTFNKVFFLRVNVKSYCNFLMYVRKCYNYLSLKGSFLECWQLSCFYKNKLKNNFNPSNLRMSKCMNINSSINLTNIMQKPEQKIKQSCFIHFYEWSTYLSNWIRIPKLQQKTPVYICHYT